MSLYQLFGNNEKMENEGIYLEYGKNSEGKPIRILVARAGGSNRAYKKALEKATKPYRKAIETGVLDDETSRQIMVDVFADTVIKSWVNVEDAEGRPLPFTKENVVKLLTELPDLYRDIQEQTAKIANFRNEEREEIAKNSGTSSSTDLSKAQ